MSTTFQGLRTKYRVGLPDAYVGGRGQFVNIVTEAVALKQEDQDPRGPWLP